MSDNRQRAHSRRDFGRAAAGAVALSTSLTREATLLADENEERDDPGWIDAHVHVWHPDTEKYPLDKGFDRSAMQPKSFTADELFSHCKPEGVNRIVLIQMSFYQYDHTYMCEMMDSHPGVFSGVAIIDHRADSVARDMEELASRGMRGFRLHSHGDAKEWVANSNMHALWRKAGKDGLAVCPLINPTDIPFVDALCEKFPDTTVVIDHFARIGISGKIESKHLNDLCRLARFKNTHIKTSAFYALGKKSPPYDDLIPMIRKVLDAFGPQRLMWASDCPFQVEGTHRYDASIGLIRDRIDFLSLSDKQWILRDTANRVFFA